MFLLASAFAGTVDLVEDSFPVHAKVSVVVEYTATTPLGPGDALLIQEPLFHGIRWAKWGFLTTNAERCTALSEVQDQASAGLVRASAEGLDLEVLHSVDGPGQHDEGWITVGILDGALAEGEVLTVELGVEGECGWQTADRAFERIELPVYEVFGRGEPLLVGIPELAFVGESEVSVVLAELPSQALVDEAVELRVVSLDRWGNAIGEPMVEEVAFAEAGVHRVEVEGARSNPIRVTQEPLEQAVWWGDLHTHHGHSYETEAGDWVDTNHLYAREVMGLDFGCESVKARPHEIEGDAVWATQQRSCREYTDTNYVAILGFEWMGGSREGHHNVYYDGCDGPLADMDMPSVAGGLWPYMETVMAETGLEMVSVPHAPSFTGHNWEVQDDRLRPIAEVYSEWGSSMDVERAGSVPEGLSRGQRLGFIASSDNHDGWLGNGLAEKSVKGGLAAILAPELSAPALLEAMQNRRTYATTGARILVDVAVVEEGEVHLPGEAWKSRSARYQWTVNGTDVVREVRLLATPVGSPELEYTLYTWYPESLDASGEMVIPWGPDELAVWLEVGQVDREQAWSTPVWLERDPAPDEPRGCGHIGGGGFAALALLLWRRR